MCACKFVRINIWSSKGIKFFKFFLWVITYPRDREGVFLAPLTYCKSPFKLSEGSVEGAARKHFPSSKSRWLFVLSLKQQLASLATSFVLHSTGNFFKSTCSGHLPRMKGKPIFLCSINVW
eukprot:c29300_g1_i1 orf=212-574(-)